MTLMGHAPGLWVSEHGEVVCSEHAPYRDTDTWRWDHFIQVTAAVERIWMEDGAQPRCENCGKTREEAERED